MLALGSLFAASCFAGAPLDTVYQCASTASRTVSGLKNLSAACPDLEAALDTLGLDKILYDGWREKLSANALSDEIDLYERYSPKRWRGAADTSAVPGIVQALKDEQARPLLSWWQALKSWFNQWLDHSDSAIAKWIKHLLDGVLGTATVSPGVLKAFVYGVTILAALAALVVVVREFLAAGISARFRRSRSAVAAGEDLRDRPIDDEGRPGDENAPAGILRALVRRLLQTGRLTKERSLTHRELITRTSLDNEEQKTVFARIARLAETLLYGSQPTSPEILELVTQQGRELLQQLSAGDRPT
jgi:hypothetical protein